MKNKLKNVSITEGWISVNERLPELDESVLLFDNWKSNGEERFDIRLGYLSEYITRKTSEGVTNHCEWGGTDYAFNITHWMPLPNPPER